MAIYALDGVVPQVADTAWVADSAQVIGQVELADGSHLPPPLDGTGKAWQYSEQDLIQIIKEGRSLNKPMYMPAFKNGLADWEINFILTYMKSKWSINQLNYQHGFMTLTPQATQTLVATPSPTNTATP